MSEGASRDVTYTLRLVGSPDNARTLADLIAAQKAVQAAVEKGEAAKQKAVEETAKKAKKASDDEEKAAVRAFQNRLKWNEIVRNERAKAEADAARQHEQSVAKMVSAQERLKSVVASGTEGLIRMARGAAMLGVVGEKDAKKLLDALVKIQAAYDIAKGAIEFYYGLTEAVKAYRTSVLAAAAAEATLNATRRGGAATTVGGNALGAVGPGLAGAAALTGVGAAAYAAYDLGSGNWREEDSYTQWGAQTYEGLATSIGQFVGALDNGKKVYIDNAAAADKMRVAMISAAAEQQQAELALKRMTESARDTARGESALFRVEMMRRRAGSGPDAQSQAIGRGVNELRRRQSEVERGISSGTLNYDDVDRLNQEAASLADRQASLLEQRLQLERQSADIGIRAARERIQAAERERDIATEIVARERERNLTVLERFGQMSRGEQAQLLAVREKADRFGANALSQRERQQLRSIGTSSAERLAREGDIAAANAAGGGRLFRAEDFAAEQAAQQRRVQAELVIQDQRRIEVVVEANFTQLAANIQAQLDQQLGFLESTVERYVETKLANDQARNRERINQERIAAQQAR